MTDTLTAGDTVTITGRAIVVEQDAKWFKNSATHLKIEIETAPGEFKYADVRLLNVTDRWWGAHDRDVSRVDQPEPAPAEGDNVTALKPTDVDSLNVRQLRETAANLGVELPAKAKRAELVATIKDAIAEQQAA